MKWEVEQRQREIEAQRQQLELVEQCSQSELDSLQTALQVQTHNQYTEEGQSWLAPQI